MSTTGFKTPSGSFSRYCHEILKVVFFNFFFGQNMLKKLISIHKLCPQPALKHPVGHFQGIAMKF